MYYIETNNNLITAKGQGPHKTEEQIEVSENIYNALTNLPAEYAQEGGEIVSVTPQPLPQPTAKEKREQEYSIAPLVEWNGEEITVDEANVIFLRYFAENDARASAIQALIISAKASIRELYPDEEE